MSWRDIVGHDQQAEYFRRNLQQGRLGSSFLFLGPAGIGKRKLALKLAQTLFCDQRNTTETDPCGICSSCIQTLANSHPDLHVIGIDRKQGKRSILKSQIVGGKKTAYADASGTSEIPAEGLVSDDPMDARASSSSEPTVGVFDLKSSVQTTHYPGLCYQLNLKPAQANRQIAIIDDADCMQDEAANALLKTLEEPPPGSVLILLASNPKKILPTIHSRCQTILFHPLDDLQVQQILLDTDAATNADQAWLMASLAGGSVEVALSRIDDEFVEVREKVCQLLPEFYQAPHELAVIVEAYVCSPKESAAQRERFQQMAEIVLSIFHLMLLKTIGSEGAGDPLAQTTMQAMLDSWVGDEETIIACVDRTIDAVTQLDANANIKTLIDAWIDDLAQTQITGGFMVPGC
ncbi:MAG: hypothetical protein VX738_01130 [Planctomycetota bacterium]|nr:hypothetical protein [Planctomycetota bacterium]